MVDEVDDDDDDVAWGNGCGYDSTTDEGDVHGSFVS